ncbi:NAD(P)H-hydrate dehydratase [Sphingobium nicotianae]|uniref:ADP-dependent (S)-NAD(P)H-hydrate dehydratase n=1 Tax=Sphingobium nicotianae TaxID=2782607 RepID=A0A9X1IRU9_9SPHN|nr:NAD(P)H-hydrate dehydratase [Sphingobium nicotianae]MBT2187679.1 NAD(P)H-hydrate dehydratase [Sphingobium nicotianae]
MTGAPILSVAQMRTAEQALFDSGIAPYALRQRAGEGAAEVIWRVGHKRDTLVLCGPGNNGGDGFVIARALRELGVPVRVAALGESRTESSLQARTDWGGPIEDFAGAEPATQIVDAVFGIGLMRGLAPEVARPLARLVEAAQHSYAIDVPSGVESDAAVALTKLPVFTHCLSLGAWKPAHVLMPARSMAAQHWLVDIGVIAPDDAAHVLARPQLQAPAADAHKYRRGLVAVVAGEMPGAASLSAESSARSGAGYVRLLSDRETGTGSHAIVRSKPLDFSRARAALVGPGLGRNDAAWDRLSATLSSGIPVVADADALWLFAEKGFGDLPRPVIATPHDGEFDHLFGDDAGNKIDCTRSAAARTGIVVVHKGPDTVIAAPDGRCAVAPSASSWLSTAGTGDVLAGLCAGRLAVSGDPFAAACEAVWLHGETARRAGAAFVADDFVAHIPAALASAL